MSELMYSYVLFSFVPLIRQTKTVTALVMENLAVVLLIREMFVISRFACLKSVDMHLLHDMYDIAHDIAHDVAHDIRHQIAHDVLPDMQYIHM